MEKNRKTNIPVKGIPQIIEWLLKNCNQEEILFMASLAGKQRDLKLLSSIIGRLTDYNIYEVFYSRIKDSEELAYFRAAKRGEVAGLKAFLMACQAARLEVEKRKEDK